MKYIYIYIIHIFIYIYVYITLASPIRWWPLIPSMNHLYAFLREYHYHPLTLNHSTVEEMLAIKKILSKLLSTLVPKQYLYFCIPLFLIKY